MKWKNGIPPGVLPASFGSGHPCPRCHRLLVRLTYGYTDDSLVEWRCDSGCKVKGKGRHMEGATPAISVDSANHPWYSHCCE